MSKFSQQVFDPAKPMVARKTFKSNGHLIKANAPFDWRQMAISQRKAKILFETGYLMHPKPKGETKVAHKTTTVKSRPLTQKAPTVDKATEKDATE